MMNANHLQVLLDAACDTEADDTHRSLVVLTACHIHLHVEFVHLQGSRGALVEVGVAKLVSQTTCQLYRV